MKQHLDIESRKALVDYRIEKSDNALKEADLLAEKGFYDSAVTRLYYACFYIASALLIKNEIEAATHSGVKRMLSLKFIHTGLLDARFIKVYADLLNGRQLSDYEDFVYQNINSYSEYKNEADEFCQEIKKLIYS
ncbi:MAG: HEPN domain-containing protein [Muribaculaceae bacterium]|nr:HEPN domain-containing protein [Muribaculaceae bacterium]